MKLYRPDSVAFLLAVALLPTDFTGWARTRTPLPTVTFVSPTECKGNHGVWRWKVKTDPETAPSPISKDHKVTVADVAAWEAPESKLKTRTPRTGREMEWFELTGKVVLVKAEEDGDLHIQLGDPDGKSKMEVVVEVPVDNNDPQLGLVQNPQDRLRLVQPRVPFHHKTGHRLKLTKRPVIRVVAKLSMTGSTAKRQRLTEGRTTRR
jgi:hypothetical protein